MALRASIEMNLHGYSLALMDMHMAMPVKLKGLDRQRNIRRRVPILAILGFVRFVQSLFRLADKDQQLLLAFSYDFRRTRTSRRTSCGPATATLGFAPWLWMNSSIASPAICLLLWGAPRQSLASTVVKCHYWCLHGQQHRKTSCLDHSTLIAESTKPLSTQTTAYQIMEPCQEEA